jgi:hypothetical protein
MTEFRRPFGPDDQPEAATGPGDGEPASDVARALATGRELDSFAARDTTAPSADFTNRVMAAIAAEPTPRPVAAAGRALSQGRLVALLATFGDLWRVAFSGGRPFAVRAQALALVAVIVIAFGSLGGAAVVGALGLLSEEAGPSPSESLSPSVAPSPSESPSASPSATPSESPSGSPSPSASPSGSRTGSPTSSPTDTAEPTETASPIGTDDSDDRTPRPGETEKPSDTPDPTGDG